MSHLNHLGFVNDTTDASDHEDEEVREFWQTLGSGEDGCAKSYVGKNREGGVAAASLTWHAGQPCSALDVNGALNMVATDVARIFGLPNVSLVQVE